MKRLLVILSLVAGLAVFTGCGPSRNTVTTQPVAPVYERPVSPGATYVWVDGDWRWQRGNYVYSNGYWSKSKPNRTWVGGTWVNTPKGYYWKKGYWRR